VIVLALDTALPACSVAVIDGERVLARLSEPMTRGHQERLATMVREAMAAAGIEFAALDRIGVTVGPGSFTGLRVGLAFAKGLALALDIPCVGIGSLQALAVSIACQGHTAAAIDAKRGQVYLQLFEDGAPVGGPEALELADAAGRMGGVGRLVGSGAPLLAPFTAGAEVVEEVAADPVAVARLAAQARELLPPRPIYLRAPDARLHGAPA
jgi:tRNA threonylcarbamoyladenosine biosynthesis protein TsaB